MELCSWLPHYLIRRFLQNLLHLHLERQQKAVGPNLMMTCNGESVWVYHVSCLYHHHPHHRPHLPSCLHCQFLGLVWSIYTVNSAVLHKKQFSWSPPTLPSLFFPEKCFTSNFLVCLMNQKNVYCVAGSDQTVWNMNIHKNKISRKLLEHVSVLIPTTNYHKPCPRYEDFQIFFLFNAGQF